MFEQNLFNLPCWPDINEHTAKEISHWSDLVEPLDWFKPLLCKIIWLYNRKFVNLLCLFLNRCVFTKKILGGQKFVETGTGKNRGFPEHCALITFSAILETLSVGKSFFEMMIIRFPNPEGMVFLVTLHNGVNLFLKEYSHFWDLHFHKIINFCNFAALLLHKRIW